MNSPTELNRRLAVKGIEDFKAYANTLTALEISELIHTDTAENSLYCFGPGEYSLLTAEHHWFSLPLNTLQNTRRSAINKGLSSWSGAAAHEAKGRFKAVFRWMSETAYRAENFAKSIQAVRTAYKTAYRGIEKPDVIRANRNQVQELLADNAMGQHSETIASLEKQYEPWRDQGIERLCRYYEQTAAAVERMPPFPELTEYLLSPRRTEPKPAD